MAKPERKDIRTTVSLAKVVWDMAGEMMEEKGFNENFSAYIADLIRRDKERQEELKRCDPPNSSNSNSHTGNRSRDTENKGSGAAKKSAA